MKVMNKAMFALALGAISSVALADAAGDLQQRLSQVSSYKADFAQRVTTAQGKLVQEGSGKFQVKRPNLFRLDTKAPQETHIIADGKTLWYYDPFVQQVTAKKVTDAIVNTPFILLTTNDPAKWQQYQVSQQGDNFTLVPKAKNSNIKKFQIRIDANGLLKNFSTVEQDGQANLYQLRNINNLPIDASVFSFKVPKGVELDDQR
ncbi:outer membrane lipoprotein chaperone LolA [Pasteurellaceae bacterium HPA106]|uniref:outer membrane lipoprotein chaperone LolA n=1 Tax=Spirabiliibacterium pneumoniae TaxID=221400 RepID=UPI001AAD9870|nr:outer membrane lipoprotein chaperone LolA [Spirabiliibacterium pneumoniae]MBE2896460.1 outer membrane lipoprotein chaperone LolA [Spirabiliibacterium pneumoniae]